MKNDTSPEASLWLKTQEEVLFLYPNKYGLITKGEVETFINFKEKSQGHCPPPKKDLWPFQIVCEAPTLPQRGNQRLREWKCPSYRPPEAKAGQRT